MFCPRCGAGTLPDQAFCKNCGAALANAESPQSVSAAASGSTPEAVSQPPAAPGAPQPPASLHAIPDGGLTLEEVVAWLQSGGYTAKVVTREDGKRHIESWSQGTLFNIFTPGCQSGRCASLELLFAFSSKGKFDISRLNEWNRDVPWCKAYYDTVNDPCLDMDIALSPGGTYESLNDQFATWGNVLGNFTAKFSLR